MANNPRPVYLLLCGLPASGKTTISTQIRDWWSRERTLVYVSTDAFIEAEAERMNRTYSEVFAEAIPEADRRATRMREAALGSRLDVLHDQTNLSLAKRNRVLKVIPEGYPTICLVASVEESIRQARLAERPGKIIPPEIDAAMRNGFVKPSIDEGFDMVVPVADWRVFLTPWLRSVVEMVNA